MKFKKSKIYLCAGGTGGHLFPALSTARTLQKKVLEKEIAPLDIACMSDTVVTEDNVKSVHLPIPRRSNLKTLPLFVLGLVFSFFKSLGVFLREKPDLVVGFGGYPSVPSVLAAQLLRIPTLLHEQNAYMGKANRYLLKQAQLVATSFEKTVHITKKIPHILTGNPVRIRQCSPYKRKDALNDKATLKILVIGGSQGAAVFSSLLPKALALLDDDERSCFHITQQCRVELHDETEKAYRDTGMHTVVLAPFFNDMQNLYENADLIIARAGASTIAEVTVAGRAALFVPYPHATDNHQYYNAKALRDACFLMEQKHITPKEIAELLRNCLQNPHKLEEKANAIRRYSMENASLALAQVIQDLLPL